MKDVRKPNFIVDVTRPFDGCDKCSTAMSSTSTQIAASPLNARWQTNDLSPWWLSLAKKDTHGAAYLANCYLDVLGSPTKPESITFKDDACNYHSNSYYCQPIQFNLAPKAGSPPSCKCTKVELAGAYSAQILVKCEKCLDVYRSNDKNSCPPGTKIFSPRSRSDWKTFIASAMPLRSPNWIIDITRPTNGCGGCAKASMNSGSPQQATWRTADGSAWWLRAAKHTQPNGDGYTMDDGTKPHGDYKANCYMNILNAPNEDGIAFDDDDCNVHSSSYYCQSVKTTTTTTPVPPPTPAPTTTTAKKAQCNAALWSNIKTNCGSCKALIKTSGPQGGTCEDYCMAQGAGHCVKVEEDTGNSCTNLNKAETAKMSCTTDARKFGSGSDVLCTCGGTQKVAR